MKLQLHTPIKTFALILSIASLALPAHHANAQETEKTTINRYSEATLGTGSVSYTDPELWHNDDYHSIGFRWVSDNPQSNITRFIELEASFTNGETPSKDGLIRSSDYEKLGFGYVFNKSKAETSFFTELAVGVFNVNHYVKGEAAWRAPESDTRSDQRATYQNQGISYAVDSVYLSVGLGVKIKNNHKLSFYIQTMSEGDLSAKSTANDNDYPDDDYDYHGAIPQDISNGMMGIRYSYLFQSTKRDITYSGYDWKPIQ